MKELTDIVGASLHRYFKVLSTLGYKKQHSIDRIIILFFIEELLNNFEMSLFVTDSDYREINKALYCLYGSDCLISLPEYSVYDNMFHGSSNTYRPRMTEDANLRVTETEEFRSIQ